MRCSIVPTSINTLSGGEWEKLCWISLTHVVLWADIMARAAVFPVVPWGIPKGMCIGKAYRLMYTNTQCTGTQVSHLLAHSQMGTHIPMGPIWPLLKEQHNLSLSCTIWQRTLQCPSISSVELLVGLWQQSTFCLITLKSFLVREHCSVI